jgi:hypothetical protein
MTAIMLHDTASAYDMNYVVLRHFNVAGADPPGRIGLGSVSAVQGAAARDIGLKCRSAQALIWLEKPRQSGQGVVSL